MTAESVLLTANSILLVIVGYFVRDFVRGVRSLRDEVNDMRTNFHSRISVLEQKNGIYNPSSLQSFTLSSEG